MWRDELQRVYTGEPRTREGHGLQPVVREFGLPRERFAELMDGVQMDLERSQYATFDELLGYCRRVASAVGLVCVEIFGYRDPAARTYAENLGIALQLTNIVRDVAADARRGRVYLPAEDLERFGVSEADLQGAELTPPIASLLRYQCERARTYYRCAAAQLPRADAGRLAAAEIMGAIYFEILERIERSGYDVFSRRIRVPRPYRAVLALRVWLHTWTGLPRT
jgi:phytoene synthase